MEVKVKEFDIFDKENPDRNEIYKIIYGLTEGFCSKARKFHLMQAFLKNKEKAIIELATTEKISIRESEIIFDKLERQIKKKLIKKNDILPPLSEKKSENLDQKPVEEMPEEKQYINNAENVDSKFSLRDIKEDIAWLESKLQNISINEIQVLLENGFLKEEIAVFYLLVINNKVDYRVIADILGINLKELIEYKKTVEEKFGSKFGIKLKGLCSFSSECDFDEVIKFYANQTYEDFISNNQDIFKFLSYREKNLLRRYFNDPDITEIPKKTVGIEFVERDINLSNYNLYKRQSRLSKRVMIEIYLKNKPFFTGKQQLVMDYFYFKTKTLSDIDKEGMTREIAISYHQYLIRKIELLYYEIYKKPLAKSLVEKVLNNDRNDFTERQRKILKMKFGIEYSERYKIHEIAKQLDEEYIKVHDSYMKLKQKILILHYNLSNYCVKKDYEDLTIYLYDERYYLNPFYRELLFRYLIDGMSYQELSDYYNTPLNLTTNKVNDAIRELNYIKYGIVKPVVIDEDSFKEFISESNYNEKQRNILESFYLLGLRKKEISETFSYSQSFIKGTIADFLSKYSKDILNLEVTKEDIICELDREPRESVLNSEEKQILSSLIDKNDEDFDSSNKRSFKNAIKSIYEKLLKRKLGILDPDFDIIKKSNMIELLGDSRLPITKEERNILEQIYGLDNNNCSLESIAQNLGYELTFLKRRYNRIILKIKEYETGKQIMSFDFNEDILPFLNYLPFSYRPIVVDRYQLSLSLSQIAKKRNISKDVVNNILTKAMLSISSFLKKDGIFVKIDYDYLESVIEKEDLPLYGNVDLKKEIAMNYFGLCGKKKSNILEIAQSLDIELSDSTLYNYAYDVLLASSKYKNGIKKEISFTFRNVMDFIDENIGNLSKKELEVLKNFLDSSDFEEGDIIDYSLLPLGVLYKIVSYFRKQKFDFSSFSRIDIINLIKSDDIKMSAYHQRILRQKYNISERESLNNKEKQRVYKILSRAYINKLSNGVKYFAWEKEPKLRRKPLAK